MASRLKSSSLRNCSPNRDAAELRLWGRASVGDSSSRNPHTDNAVAVLNRSLGVNLCLSARCGRGFAPVQWLVEVPIQFSDRTSCYFRKLEDAERGCQNAGRVRTGLWHLDKNRGTQLRPNFKKDQPFLFGKNNGYIDWEHHGIGCSEVCKGDQVGVALSQSHRLRDGL